MVGNISNSEDVRRQCSKSPRLRVELGIFGIIDRKEAKRIHGDENRAYVGINMAAVESVFQVIQ